MEDKVEKYSQKDQEKEKKTPKEQRGAKGNAGQHET